MAVKYRIEYCNASNDTARLDIYVRDYSGSIIPVEGSADLFLLEYKADNYIVSSIADIQIYNSTAFNIDVLKTSDETELKALFYVNGILKWNGFILPDFFSTELTDNSVISMTATDRLSVLKDVTLAYSTAKISYIKLISDCLIKTGLEMDINVVADFMQVSQPSTFNIMDCYVEHSRITSRNKSLSAYDVLKSVLILLNAKLMQYGGAWWIVNRYQAQTTGGRVFTYNEVGVLQTSGTFTPQQIPFTLVEASGRRTIEPVASQTSVFMEFGGVKRYPADYEFKNYSGGYEGWTAVNGFNYTNTNKEVLSYNASGTAIYGTRDIAFRMKNNNSNVDFYLLANIPLSYNKYIKSTAITNNIDGKIKVNVMLSATSMNKTFMPVLVVIDTKNADTSKRYYAYGRDGIVSLRATFATTEVNKSSFQIVYFRDEDVPETSAINAVSNLNIELDPSDVGAQTLIGADISLFMFGTNCDVFVNEASIGISNISDGKGILYRVDQGAGNYTKKHDTDTTIFGDYILQGINGFFYNYTSDELSIHTYLSNRINGGWTSPGDTQADPILLHSVRQRARIYSKAKNVFNVQIIEAFNPLGIYTCGGNSYIVRSAKHNFLRSETNVELEEIVYQDLSKIDFVYTYFGDEKDKSITGISGISGTSGGGTSTAVPSHDNLKGITTITDTLEDGATTIHLTKEVAVSLLSTITNFNSWFELDTTVTPNAIKVTKDFYSTGEIAAFGYGGSGGGGGTIYNLHQLAGESISSSPADKSRLEYNATTGKWENKAGLDLSIYATETELNTAVSSIAWSSITGEPTTLLGYGITDAVTSSDFTAHVNSNLHLTSGQRTLLANTTANFTTALETKLNGIAAGAEVNVQSDWNATSGDAFIANKPTVFTPDTHDHYVSDILNFPTSMPASDVSAWAKASVKPTYVWSEIGSKPTTLSGYGIASTDTMFDSKYLGISANAVSATKLANARTIAGTSFDGTANIDISYNNLTNLPSLAFLPLAGGTMTGNLTMGLTTDIITNFKTWTKDSSKSLKSFLDKFDIDANGNLVVLGNLYSTGEVTAYSNGTGVSGLTLMGDMNANNKNINNVLNISAQQVNSSKISAGALQIGNDPTGDFPNCVGLFGYRDDEVATYLNLIATYKENTGEYIYANNLFVVDSAGQAAATSFKFGNYSFKQSANGLSICYNGVEQAYITNTGQYVNS